MQVWLERSRDDWDLVTEISRDVEKGLVTVCVGNENQTVPEARTVHVDPTHLLDLDDLCDMSSLHEGPVLNMLRKRSSADKIYTNTGDVLISINPYRAVPGLYDSPLRYFLPIGMGTEIARLPPHLFKTANDAYRNLAVERRNQSIIISGESGAGKTEGSKYVMNFLIAVNHEQITRAGVVDDATVVVTNKEGAGERMRRVLLESNTIFESFGNAKTVRNDNSSRFGKYIRLQYTSNDVLVSAFTETFLLERSRLTSPPAEGERRYHVFYGLFVGTDKLLSHSELKLDGGMESFSMLCQPSGKSPILPDDAANFSLLCASLRTLGVTDVELKEVFSLLATILHISTASVTEGASESDPVQLTFATQTVAAIAKALGLPEDSFLRAVRIHILRLGNRDSTTDKILSVDTVENNLHALIKWLYSALFKWLVTKINYAHCSHYSVEQLKHEQAAVKFIGILDIFGFEILKHNSFEQLCINYTNERLQQQFNDQIFVTEQTDYIKEGLDWTIINFRSNQNVVDLISKKPTGLLNILEEHGFMNRRPDDIALLHNFDHFHKAKNECYAKSRYGDEAFIVSHFAGKVEYEIAGFIEKNNDTLQEDLLRLLRHSSNAFLLNMSGIIVETSTLQFDSKHREIAPGFVPAIPDHMIVRVVDGETMLEDAPVYHPKASSLRHRSSIVAASSSDAALGNKMAASVTVSYQFRHQLEDLMSTLKTTHPHYIKCIKPNENKIPNKIVSPIVLEQLRYSGILEVVRIRREGYSIRIPVQEFYKTFQVLGAGNNWARSNACTEVEAKEFCLKIMEAVFGTDPKLYQVGHWKVFLKDDALNQLYREVLHVQQIRAITIQTYCRGWIRLKKYQQGRRSTRALQAAFRGKADRHKFIATLRAIAKLQVFFVHVRARKLMLNRVHAATIIRRNIAILAAARLARGRGARERQRIRDEQVQEAERLRVEREMQLAREEAERKETERLEKERIERENAEAERLHILSEQKLAASLLLQRVFRGVKDRKIFRYRKRVHEFQDRMNDVIIPLQAHVRGKLGISCSRRLGAAIGKIRKNIIINIRNFRLYVRIMKLHRWCRTGDVEAVADHLTNCYDDIKIRNKWQNYQTCLHSAVQGGQLDILDILRPTAEEVLEKDINGYTALHHAAMFPNLQVVQYLERVLLLKNTASTAGSISIDEDWGTENSDLDDGGSDSDTSSVVARLENTDFGEKIKEGWLKKVTRGFMGGMFGPGVVKRWVVLYENHLLYFKSPDDLQPRGAIPIEGTLVKRSIDTSRYGFDVFSDSMSMRRKKIKRSLEFLAETEIELQEWLVQLMSLVGVDHAFRNDPIVHYINSNLRAVWLAEQNNFGETPLHIAARYLPKNKQHPGIVNTCMLKPVTRNVLFLKEPPKLADDQHYLTLIHVTQFCLWLIEAGCPLDIQSNKGETALHVAAVHQNAILAAVLIRKGAGRQLLDNSGVLAESYANAATTAAMRRAIDSHALLASANVDGISLSPRPTQLRGFSYLHVLFEKHDSEGKIPTEDRTYLLISVLNSREELIEDTQCVSSPMIVHKDAEYWGRNYLWWGHTWHMQTPLENIENENCVIRIELHKYINDKQAVESAATTKKGGRRGSLTAAAAARAANTGTNTLIARALFPLNLRTIDSGLVTIPFLPPGTKPITAGGPRVAEHSCMQADLVLSKRSNIVSLDKYRKMHSQYNLSRPAVFTSVDSSQTFLDTTAANRSSSLPDYGVQEPNIA